MITNVTDPNLVLQQHMANVGAANIVLSRKDIHRIKGGRQDFQRYSGDAVLQAQKVGKTIPIPTDEADIRKETSRILNLISTIESLTPQSRYDFWKSEVKGDVYLHEATRRHFYNLLHSILATFPQYYLTEKKGWIHVAKIKLAIGARSSELHHWVREAKPDQLIRDFIAGPKELKNYLVMEVNVFHHLIYKFFCIMSSRLEMIEESYMIAAKCIKEKAIQTMTSAEFRSQASGQAQRNAEDFLRKTA
jgi:hypothetical protein